MEVPTLSDLYCDCGHLAELIGAATDYIQDFAVGDVITRPILDRHAALLWIARALADELKKGLELAGQQERRLALQCSPALSTDP